MDIIIFDTETTTIPNDNLPANDPNQAYPVQLAWIVADLSFQPIKEQSLVISPPKDIVMHPRAEATHGKSLDYCWQHGIPFEEALEIFRADCEKAAIRAAYNIPFDDKIMRNAYMRHFPKEGPMGIETDETSALTGVFAETAPHCVMRQATAYLRVPAGNGGYRNVKLSQAYRRITGRKMLDAHDALGDVRGTLTIFRDMMETTPIPVEQTD